MCEALCYFLWSECYIKQHAYPHGTCGTCGQLADRRLHRLTDMPLEPVISPRKGGSAGTARGRVALGKSPLNALQCSSWDVKDQLRLWRWRKWKCGFWEEGVLGRGNSRCVGEMRGRGLGAQEKWKFQATMARVHREGWEEGMGLKRKVENKAWALALSRFKQGSDNQMCCLKWSCWLPSRQRILRRNDRAVGGSN